MNRIHLFVTALLSALLIASAAVGQGGQRGTMVIQSGGERHALSYARPNVDLLVQPYVNGADVPTFVVELDLSDAQRAAVQRLIDAYLEDFRALLKDKHPDPERDDGINAMLGGPGEDEETTEGGPGDGPDQNARDRERDDVNRILLEELKADGIVKESLDELPVEPQIGIGLSLRQPNPDAPPELGVDVSIGFGSEDDRLDEALRSKLEQAAERAVPRIAESVRKHAQNDLNDGGEQVDGQTPVDQIAAQWDELQALRERVAEFKKEHETLLTKLFSNVKRLLSESQLQRWPGFERALRRFKTLPWGQLDGESTDLISMVGDLELTESQRAALSEALANYERQLDAALQRRNDLLETADQEIDVALYTGDYDEALSIAERLARSRVAVRNLNDRTVETLAAQLDERTAKTVRREVLATSYPTIYRRTIGQQAFEEVILTDTLDADLQVAVLELAERHGQLISAVNDRLRRSVRREQQRELTRDVERAIDLLQGEQPGRAESEEQSAIAMAFQERRDIDVRYMRMLYDMVPESVTAKLPAIPRHDVGERVKAEHRETPAAEEY